MKRVATIKLAPTPEEADVPRRPLERVNEACNWLAARAFETGTIRPFDLHKPCYRDLRKRFELTAQVARLGNWSFGQLQTFIAYQARRAGIPAPFVDPKYTSKGRPACGAIDAKNRANQATFSCILCRHARHADAIAARDIRCRAEAARVNWP